MSATTTGTFSTYPSLLTYRLLATEISYDTAANTSQVYLQTFIDFTGSSASSSGGSGTTTAGSWTYGSISFSGAGSVEVYSNVVTVAHNADGTGSYSFSGTSTMSGWGNATTGTGVLTLTTINRAAGKRWTGSAWVDNTVNKRWTGTAWVDLTIKKRWSGSAWVNLD